VLAYVYILKYRPGNVNIFYVNCLNAIVQLGCSKWGYIINWFKVLCFFI